MFCSLNESKRPPEYHKNMVPRRPAILTYVLPRGSPLFRHVRTLCIQDSGFCQKMQVFFVVRTFVYALFPTTNCSLRHVQTAVTSCGLLPADLTSWPAGPGKSGGHANEHGKSQRCRRQPQRNSGNVPFIPVMAGRCLASG